MNSQPPAKPPEMERLDRLDREVRWLTALATFLAVFCALLLTWQLIPRGQSLEARRFVLRDAEGKSRAELALREDGGPMFRLNNANERARIMLLVRADGSTSVRLTDEAGVHRAQLSLDPRRLPELLLAGSDGRSLITLGTVPDGAPHLVLRDTTRTVLWAAPPEPTPRLRGRE